MGRINEKTIYISTEEFNAIMDRILGLLKEAPISVQAILDTLKGIKKEKVWKVVNYLQAENKILADKEGNITITWQTKGL